MLLHYDNSSLHNRMVHKRTFDLYKKIREETKN